MKIHYNGTTNGNSVDVQYEYKVIATTSTGYKVNFTLTSGGTTIHYTAFALKNGTAAWVYYSGSNYTGIQAFSLYFGAAAYLFIEQTFGLASSEFTLPAYMHVVNMETIMIGPTSVSVTNYATNSVPLNITTCDGSSDFTKLSIQTGKVTGVNLSLLTYMAMTGSFSTGGSTENVNITLQVTSLTKA